MARTILTILIVVLLNVLVGCQGVEGSKSQLVPRPETSDWAAAVVNIAEAGEVDIVEQVSVNRQAYRQGLELLVKYYTRVGNNMKLEWARKELAALDTMPKYKYIIEASVAPANLKASTLIPEADALYREAFQLQKRAGPLTFIKNENLLRLALDKYNQLIRKHPYSDKIDDAAYRGGGIYEYFKDYTIALLYYQRAYQWDPDTIHPARFKAAYILDRRLHRRAEALELYQQFIKGMTGSEQQREFAQRRIEELTQSDKEDK